MKNIATHENIWSIPRTFCLISWLCPYSVISQSTSRTQTITPNSDGNETQYCELLFGGIGATCLSTGLCIETDALCNGVDDCGDGQDERQCPESDDCTMKSEMVQKVKQECTLRHQTLRGIPDSLYNRWTFNATGNANREYVTQVTLNTSRQNVRNEGGTVLYQTQIGSSLSRFLFNGDSPLRQTRDLPVSLRFDAASTMVTIKVFDEEFFYRTNIDEFDLSITVSSGDCASANLSCLLLVGDLLLDDGYCPKNLKEDIYTSIYKSDFCPPRPECEEHQFACRSGLCIPFDAMCDGFYDCTGSNEDELPYTCTQIGSCPVASAQYLFETVSLCSNVRSIFFEYNTEETSFVWEDVEVLYLTEIFIPAFDVSITKGLNRFNITTPSSSISIYQQMRHPMRGYTSVPLKKPLPVDLNDRVTITKEFTPDYFRQPFMPLTVSLSLVRGFQLTSCEAIGNCIDILNSGTNEEFLPNCAFFEYENFLLDLYAQCRVPPNITYISQNASVAVGDVYTAVCHANGLPTPTIHWFDASRRSLSLHQQFGPVSFIHLQLGMNETFTEVTCRAVSGNVTQEQTVRLTRFELQDCKEDTIALLNEPAECFAILTLVSSPVFGSVTNLIFNVTFHGLIYKVNFGERLLSQYGQVVDLTLEVSFAGFSVGERRTERGVENLLYRKSYRRIVTENNTELPIYPPLRVTNGSMINVSISTINLVTIVNEKVDYLNEFVVNRTVSFSGISCEPATCDADSLEDVLADGCFDGYYNPEFDKFQMLSNTLKTCQGLTSEEPYISLQPPPLLEVPIGNSVSARCNAEHSVGITWYKREWYGDIETGVVGNILRFERVSSEDQGIYYCRAHGLVGFEDSPANSEPVLIALSGRETVLMELTFMGLQYSDDLADPTSSSYLEVSEDIQDYIVYHLVEFGDGRIISGFNDVTVQRLTPGSIVAEARITLLTNLAIEEIGRALSSGNSRRYENFNPDLQSLRIRAMYFCDEDFLNNTLAGELTFSKTRIAQTANSTEVCPSYTDKVGEPRAVRTCDGDFVSPGYWGEVQLNNCYKQAEDEEDSLKKLDKFLETSSLTNENVTPVSYDVADATETKNLDANDLVIIAGILDMIASLESPSPEVTRNIIRVVDNILNLEEDVYNQSTPFEAPSRIVQSLETQLTNLHRGSGEHLNFTVVGDYIAVMALAVNEDYVQSEVTFGNFFTSDERDITETLNNSIMRVFEGSRPSILDDVKASITLPSSLLDGFQNDSSGNIGLTFAVYRSSNLFISRGSKPAQDVESLVVAATIEGKEGEISESPVVERFYLLPVDPSVLHSTRRCVFWDFSLGGGFGDWSSEGCTLVSGPGENGEPIVECHCDHLTNFAILVDIQGDIGNVVLDVLSIIGCVISIIALAVVLVTFLSIKKLRSKRPQQVLINLCFALLGLYLSFLIGINRSNLTVGCVIFGAMIHYFCLASVAWMSVEATIMYLLFVKVFDSGIRYFMRKASLLAWGIPLVVVIVSAILRPNYYTGNHCFPQAGTLTFIIAVAVLLGVMLCYNLIMFVLVIRTLTCRKRVNESEKNVEAIKRVQNAIAVSVLLGLGWLFGFFAIGRAQFIFNLLFLILNSLQGVFVFVFFCLRNKDVVAVWRSKFKPAKESVSDPKVLKKSDENRSLIGTAAPANSMSKDTTESGKETEPESIQMLQSQ